MGGGTRKTRMDSFERKSGTGNAKTSTIEHSDEYKMVPPDGGWGWIVVLASFLIHVIMLGILYSFGIFYIEFLHYFKGGKGETAWVGSLITGITYLVGPIASILTNKYGCRVTAIGGALIAAGGFILSLLAPNLYFLYFSFGLLGGLGFGLMYLPAVVSVGYYFEDRRALATGLAVCGSGVGAFVFNPLCKYLIDKYGCRGAILIEAGIILNCVLAGALFRPLKPQKVRRFPGQEASNSQKTHQCNPEDFPDNRLEIKKLISHAPSISKNDKSSSQPSLIKSDDTFVKPFLHHTMCSNSETALHQRLTVDRPISSHSINGPIYLGGSFGSIFLHHKSSCEDKEYNNVASSTLMDTTGPILCCSMTVCNTLTQSFDFSLFKNGIFLLYVVSNVFTNIGYHVPFIFLADRALDEGISPEDAKWLLSAIGISNTIGRIVFGFLADRMSQQRLLLYNTSLVICGISTSLCPWCYNYPLLMIYACVFGITIGIYVTLIAVVLVDLLGLNMLTNSLGLLMMFQGFATIIGPPIGGWMYDITGSYDVTFIITGVIVGTSGVILFAIPLMKYLRRDSLYLATGIEDIDVNVRNDMI